MAITRLSSEPYIAAYRAMAEGVGLDGCFADNLLATRGSAQTAVDALLERMLPKRRGCWKFPFQHSHFLWSRGTHAKRSFVYEHVGLEKTFSAGPCSTTSPCCMIRTLSEMY